MTNCMYNVQGEFICRKTIETFYNPTTPTAMPLGINDTCGPI